MSSALSSPMSKAFGLLLSQSYYTENHSEGVKGDVHFLLICALSLILNMHKM